MYEILKNGHFVKQDIAYKSLMKRHIKKHTSYLQPIFEAISNALEATSGSKDTITIRLKFSKMLMKDILEFNSIEISDTGIGFNEENLKRLRSIYDESKSFNNLGTGRIQYLHFFDKTDIYSTYQENGVLKKRRIVLSANFWDKENAVIWEGDPIVTSDEQTGTNISFYFPLYEEDKIRYTELSTSELYDKIFLRYLSRFCLNKKNLQKIKIQRYINDIHDEHVLAIDVEPFDSNVSETVLIAYGNSSSEGRTGINAFSAKAPCPISLRPGPLDGLVSPTEYDGKL
mgnify:CR=1 FL=1